ncbi:hypothetical protein Golob_024020 [Gossypium lobatum]|uniref:Myb/SANT-like domain-containing protein n=1 Tax=Gossypium lobatum TaxID=34289 RepID=A0A7J8NDF6_9ROSI|nr:hypothetical protein [Gossypium lobatum]
MLSGKDNSGFGWDEYRQMVVAEDATWNSYISKKEPLGKMLKQLQILLKK